MQRLTLAIVCTIALVGPAGADRSPVPEAVARLAVFPVGLPLARVGATGSADSAALSALRRAVSAGMQMRASAWNAGLFSANVHGVRQIAAEGPVRLQLMAGLGLGFLGGRGGGLPFLSWMVGTNVGGERVGALLQCYQAGLPDTGF